MENHELLMLAKDGDKASKDKLVTENTRLVWSIARRYVGRGYDLEDLFQIGCIGLIKAIDRFDVSYNVQFSTYAVPMIAGEIKRVLRDSGAIRVSRTLKEMNYRIVKYRDEYIKKSGAEPTIDEIARDLDIGEEDIVMAMEAASCLAGHEQLEDYKGTVDDTDRAVDNVMVEQLLSRLSKSEQDVIKLRFYSDKTQSETGAMLGMSQVQVSRVEKRALMKMKNSMTA